MSDVLETRALEIADRTPLAAVRIPDEIPVLLTIRCMNPPRSRKYEYVYDVVAFRAVPNAVRSADVAEAAAVVKLRNAVVSALYWDVRAADCVSAIPDPRY